MKSRIALAIITLILLAGGTSESFGQKKKKAKDKRFEPVVGRSLKDYEGTYVGIDETYVLEIRLGPDGQLAARSTEAGQTVGLSNVKVEGARLTATKTYADGGTEKLGGTFANRILNGETAFGILVDGLDLRLDGGTTLNRVFYRRRQK